MPTPYFPVFANRKQDAQTIHAPFQAYVGISGVAFPAAATSIDITANLTTALATAARNSRPVILQESTNDEQRGVITRLGLNRVLVYEAGTRKIDINGAEVYGRITLAGGVYTVSFFSINPATGLEVVASVPAQGLSGLSFEVPYLFDFHEIPSNALIAVTTRNVKEDATTAGAHIAEELTIATLNTVPSLTNAPNIISASVFFDYRGFHLSANLVTSVMTVTGAGAITYDAATAGIDLNVGEVITAYYSRAV